LEDWLPEDDLAWGILDAVAQMELATIERTDWAVPALSADRQAAGRRMAGGRRPISQP
jgi:hypothetical protein